MHKPRLPNTATSLPAPSLICTRDGALHSRPAFGSPLRGSRRRGGSALNCSGSHQASTPDASTSLNLLSYCRADRYLRKPRPLCLLCPSFAPAPRLLPLHAPHPPGGARGQSPLSNGREYSQHLPPRQRRETLATLHQLPSDCTNHSHYSRFEESKAYTRLFISLSTAPLYLGQDPPKHGAKRRRRGVCVEASPGCPRARRPLGGVWAHLCRHGQRWVPLRQEESPVATGEIPCEDVTLKKAVSRTAQKARKAVGRRMQNKKANSSFFSKSIAFLRKACYNDRTCSMLSIFFYSQGVIFSHGPCG